MGNLSVDSRSGSGSDSSSSAEWAIRASLSDRRSLDCHSTGAGIEVCLGSPFWGCGNPLGHDRERLAGPDPGKPLANLAMGHASSASSASGRTARESGRGDSPPSLAVAIFARQRLALHLPMDPLSSATIQRLAVFERTLSPKEAAPILA